MLRRRRFIAKNRNAMFGRVLRKGGESIPGPTVSRSPAFSGTETVGSTLTLTSGASDGDNSTTQLLRGATVLIANVTNGQTYDVVADDAGSALTLRYVTTFNAGGTTIETATTQVIPYVAPTYALAIDGGAINEGQTVGRAEAGPDVEIQITGNGGAPDLPFALEYSRNGGTDYSPLTGTFAPLEGETVVIRLSIPSHPTGAYVATSAPVVVGAATTDITLTPTADGELEIDNATGVVTITITSPAEYATYNAGNGPGVFIFNAADLAAGPVNLVPPQIIDDGTPEVGETLTLTPGLWVYDVDAGGLTAAAYQWQADTGGNGSFVNIAGATSDSYVLTSDEAGDDVRVRETLSDNGGSRVANAAAVSISGGGPTPLDYNNTFAVPGDLTGWTLNNANITDPPTHVTGDPFAFPNGGSDGDYMQLTDTGFGNAGNIHSPIGAIPVNAGTEYDISGLIKASATGNLSVITRLQWLDAADGSIIGSAEDINNGFTGSGINIDVVIWDPATPVRRTAPAGSTHLRLRIVASGLLNSPVFIDVHGVRVKEVVA